jgi:hypothetical protein
MPKATKAEVEHRIDEVYDLLINRITYRAVIGYGANKWGVKERQMNVYISRALERMKAANKESEEDLLAKTVASYQSIYARQVADKDYGGARLTLDSLSRLQGLTSKDKKNLAATLGQKGYVGFDPEEI